MKRIDLKETDSTQYRALEYLSGGEDVVVTAERQTAGMGSKGRDFSSQEGGVYLSVLRFYRHFPAEEAFRVMMHSAAAVCKTAEHFHVDCEIKWPNDVFSHKKKIAGILIKNFLSEGKLYASVTGIGLNVFNPLKDLPNAGKLSDFTDETLSVFSVREKLIENLFSPFSDEEYFSRVKFLGQKILIDENGARYEAKALEILADGRLRIERDGKERILSSSEIQIYLE